MRYQVDLCYRCYVSKVVEAESEEEAAMKVEGLGIITEGVDTIIRDEDSDMIEETDDEPTI